MDNFPKVLKDLLSEKQISVKQLQEYLNLSDVSRIYTWLRGEKGIKLDNAIALANYFNCSIDFLMGKKEFDDADLQFKPCPPFGEQLKKVLKENLLRIWILRKKYAFTQNCLEHSIFLHLLGTILQTGQLLSMKALLSTYFL